TKRDAPLIFAGSALPPAGSAVFLKSRLRLYSDNPITVQLNCGSAACTRRCRGAWIKSLSEPSGVRRTRLKPPRPHSAKVHRRDNGRNGESQCSRRVRKFWY